MKLTPTQLRALRTIARTQCVAEVALEMEGPVAHLNADRCVAALVRRGLVARDESGDPDVTDAGRVLLRDATRND